MKPAPWKMNGSPSSSSHLAISSLTQISKLYHNAFTLADRVDCVRTCTLVAASRCFHARLASMVDEFLEAGRSAMNLSKTGSGSQKRGNSLKNYICGFHLVSQYYEHPRFAVCGTCFCSSSITAQLKERLKNKI